MTSTILPIGRAVVEDTPVSTSPTCSVLVLSLIVSLFAFGCHSTTSPTVVVTPSITVVKFSP